MARTDTLGHFLTDVADAIREKKGSSDTIQASDFDTEIENLPSSGVNELISRTSSNYVVDWQRLTIPDTITILNDLFSGAKKFTVLPKFGFNNNITSVSSLYASCTALTTVDMSDWNISNVTDMSSIFNGCSALTTLILPTIFPTGSVNSMQ